jgi:hypothetical protein
MSVFVEWLPDPDKGLGASSQFASPGRISGRWGATAGIISLFE